MRSCAGSASTTAGATSATGSRSTSIQRTRGSRRNHRSWRTANWRVRSDDRGDGLVERRPRPSRCVEQLLVAERLARRCATAPGRRRARATSASRPASIIAVDPLLDPRRRAPAAASAGRSARRRSAGRRRAPGPNELNGRPLPSVDLERPHDAAAVAGLDASRRRPGRARRGGRTAPAVSRLGLELGADVGPLARAGRGRSRRRSGRARCRRRAAAGRAGDRRRRPRRRPRR